MNVDEREIEELDADDAKIAQMLAGLKRVNAPANFEFRLKARIANAAPPTVGVGFLPSFVRYAAPLALVAAVALLYFMNSSNSPNPGVDVAGVAPQISKVAEAVIPPAVDQPLAGESEPARTPAASNPSRQTAAARSASVKTDVRAANQQPDRSAVKAVSPAKIIMPRGFETVDPTANPVTPDSNRAPLSASQFFPFFGVDAGYGEDGWKVRAVKTNSSADQAGVKAGDVLEAVDGNQLGKDAVFKSGFIGKILRVRRDGKLVELALQNK